MQARTDRLHDLPPRWDGRIVVWQGWQAQPPAFICPPPRPSCCIACGSTAQRVINSGLVARSPRITHTDLADDEENRRRLGSLAHKRPLIATYRLRVFRCPDCRHDEVHDGDTDQLWELDDSDYGDDGSVDPDLAERGL